MRRVLSLLSMRSPQDYGAFPAIARTHPAAGLRPPLRGSYSFASATAGDLGLRPVGSEGARRKLVGRSADASAGSGAPGPLSAVRGRPRLISGQLALAASDVNLSVVSRGRLCKQVVG